MNKPKTIKITRSKAVELLNALPANKIASVTFVARGDANISPYVRVMSIRTHVSKHLMGGELPYKPEDHGLMGVFEVINKTTALKRYRDKAAFEIKELEPQIAPAESALESARNELAAKGGATARGNKGRVNAVGVKERKLNALTAKLAHARLKIANPHYALLDELKEAIERRNEEIVALTNIKIPQAKQAAATGDPAKIRVVEELENTLKEARARHAKLCQYYLGAPEESLLIRYRQINLSGLLSLRINGTNYKVSTPPSPAVPANPKPVAEDPEPAHGSYN